MSVFTNRNIVIAVLVVGLVWYLNQNPIVMRVKTPKAIVQLQQQLAAAAAAAGVPVSAPVAAPVADSLAAPVADSLDAPMTKEPFRSLRRQVRPAARRRY